MNPLEQFKEALAMDAHGMTKKEAHSKGVCISCKENIRGKLNARIDFDEYRISGYCPECHDKLMGGS